MLILATGRGRWAVLSASGPQALQPSQVKWRAVVLATSTWATGLRCCLRAMHYGLLPNAKDPLSQVQHCFKSAIKACCQIRTRPITTHHLSCFIFTYTTSISLSPLSLSLSAMNFSTFFFPVTVSVVLFVFLILWYMWIIILFSSVFFFSLSSQLYIKNKLFSLIFLPRVVIKYKSWLIRLTATCHPCASSLFMFWRLEIWRAAPVLDEVQPLSQSPVVHRPSACLDIPEQWPYMAFCLLKAPVVESSHSTSVFKVFIKTS